MSPAIQNEVAPVETRLDQGSITGKLLKFALPMMAGNLLQQVYNIADTLIVGRFLGADALAAVGSSYTLMTFLTSILLGLSMGAGAYFSIQYGREDLDKLRQGVALSFGFIGAAALVLNGLMFALLEFILRFLRVPPEVTGLMRSYLRVIFIGLVATFLYNFFANLLRSVGNSAVPLYFLCASAIGNVVLDLVFVLVFHWGVAGAAAATVLAQYASGLGLMVYFWLKCPHLRPRRRHLRWDRAIMKEISGLSLLTCLQQSIMNFGILMVQGLVNSFGTAVMAAFAAAVKIDSFAYSPVQDFGNAFSTFVAQNYGAGQRERIQKGFRSALGAVFLFCAIISAGVCLFAPALMGIFVEPGESEIVAIGVSYLRIEGACYFGIGLLFLFYGYYRAVKRPGMSVVLTILSLGTRVALAYLLSALPGVGETGIWVSVPIGWALADLCGGFYYFKLKKHDPVPLNQLK